MQLRFLDRRGVPLVDAVVSVSASPGPHTDIGMLTDDEGCIELSIAAAGRWGFSVFHDGSARTVWAQLAPGQAGADVVV